MVEVWWCWRCGGVGGSGGGGVVLVKMVVEVRRW